MNDFDVKMPFPLSTPFGWYTWPCSKDAAEEGSALDQCGPGIMMYFKLLKGLLVVFLLMTLLTLPSLIMYSVANVEEPVQRKFTEAVLSQRVLGYTTLGALGEPIPSCRQVFEGDAFAFRCPAGGSVRSIVAYYGQPLGSCTCPGDMQTVAHNACNGTRSGAISQMLVSNKYNFAGQHCVSDSSGRVQPCFLGATRYDMPCCSASLDASGYADLSALSLGIAQGCNSFTAPYVLEALCLGKTTCTLPVSVRPPNACVMFHLIMRYYAADGAGVVPREQSAERVAGGDCVSLRRERRVHDGPELWRHIRRVQCERQPVAALRGHLLHLGYAAYRLLHL